MKLNPGEIICPRCDGSGYQSVNKHETLGECFKCKGEGKLDWVEAVVGKKPDNDIFNGVTWMSPSGSNPKHPIIGQAYINTNNNQTYVYDGNTWVKVVRDGLYDYKQVNF